MIIGHVLYEAELFDITIRCPMRSDVHTCLFPGKSLNIECAGYFSEDDLPDGQELIIENVLPDDCPFREGDIVLKLTKEEN